MTIRFTLTALAATAGLVLLSAPAAAQDFESYQQRQEDLSELAELFGELHHIRRNCEPRFEGDIWRERMKTLLELEEPQASESEAMVQRFNRGYRNAQRRYPVCDRRARDYAASRAAQGDRIVARLTQSLREEDGEVFSTSPYVITPPVD
ncbi:MAG: TIGR02301 family protein [Pseudomonadota bacterium]